MSASRYTIEGKIGQGGAGAVYKAEDTFLGRPVAIKKLHIAAKPTKGNITSGTATRETLLREAATLSSIQHPNIVTLYDVGQDEDGPFVVMEYLDGQSLEDVIETAPLPEREFLILARDVLSGLSAAHARSILHRDMKPSNIMLQWLPTGEPQFKILDFGLAKYTTKPAVQTMDASGGVMGSIHFMSPEQFERTPLDARTDLYSTGCVFFHALTGNYPFAGKTGPQVMMAHMRHDVGPLAELRPDLPPALVDWVLRLTSRLKDDRPSSALEALQSLPG